MYQASDLARSTPVWIGTHPVDIVATMEGNPDPLGHFSVLFLMLHKALLRY